MHHSFKFLDLFVNQVSKETQSEKGAMAGSEGALGGEGEGA